MAGFAKEYSMLFALNGQLQSGFTQSFTKASATVRDMQKDIAELNSQQSQISAYERQQAAIQKTEDKLQLLKKQYDNIQTELEETGGKSSDLQNKLLSKQAQIDKTSDSLNKQTAELNKMGDAMSEAGIDVNNLKNEQERLAKETGELKLKQEQAAEEAQKMGDSTVDAINAAANALTATGIVTGFKELVKAYGACFEVSGDFQSAMSQVAATMGTTSGSVTELSDNAKEMGATTSFTAVQAADGLNILAMAGLNADEQIAGLPTVLDLAAAGGMDMAQSAGYITTTVKGFSDSMDNATYYADLMAKGATLANTNVSQLGEALATSGATAASYSQKADSVTLSLLRLADQGEVGSAAGTMLNRAMADLYTPTEEASEALDDLGVSAYDSTGKAKDFNDLVAELKDSLTGYTEEQKNAYLNTIFTTNGLQAFNKMTVSTTDKVNQFKDGLAKASGSTAQQAQTQLDNMNGAYTIMQSAVEGVQISMGELWQDEMTNVYKVAGDILTQVNEFIKSNPTLMKAITGSTAALATLTAGIVAFKAANAAATAASGLLGLSLGGLPLLGVAAGIAGVVTVGAGLYDSLTANDRAAAEMSEQASALQDTMDSAKDTFSDTVTNVEATRAAADRYIDKLEELESTGLKTDDQQKEYHNTLELLCQTVPDLADHIDLENNKIEGGTAALRANTEAWEQNAKAQAYQTELQSVYEANAKVQIEAEKNSIKLTDAQQKLADAQKKYDAEAKEYSDTMKEYYERLDKCSESGENYVAVHEEMERYDRNEQDALFEVENELYAAQDAYDVAQKAVENDQEALAQANDEIALAEEAYNNLTDAKQTDTEATEEHANSADDFVGIINDTVSSMNELTKTYNDAYEAAAESITGQWGLWDQAAEITATDINTMNENIEGQQKYWEEYNSNLDLLSSKVSEFDGLSDVLAGFVDGSEESVNAVAGIAEAIKNGDDGSVQRLIDNYKNLQSEQDQVSQSVADMQTEYTSQMQTLTDTASSEVEKLDLSDEARSNARATVNGYISEISGSTGRVSAAYRKLYESAKNALNTDGYASGTTSAEAGVKLVGENGPELVEFHGGEVVHNADDTRSILAKSELKYQGSPQTTNNVSQSVSPSINVNFNISGGTGNDTITQLRQFGDDFAQRVLDVIRDYAADSERMAFT